MTEKFMSCRGTELFEQFELYMHERVNQNNYIGLRIMTNEKEFTIFVENTFLGQLWTIYLKVSSTTPLISLHIIHLNKITNTFTDDYTYLQNYINLINHEFTVEQAYYRNLLFLLESLTRDRLPDVFYNINGR